MIGSTAFGLKVGSLENSKAPFRECGRKVFDYDFYRNMEFLIIFFIPGLVKYLKPKFFGKKATNFLRSVFWDVIEQRVDSGQKRNDVIDLLIEMREKYKNDESLKHYSMYLLQFLLMKSFIYLFIIYLYPKSEISNKLCDDITILSTSLFRELLQTQLYSRYKLKIEPKYKYIEYIRSFSWTFAMNFNLHVSEFEGDDLVSQAAIFFTAGFETSSTTMSFTLHEVALNPDIQKRLRAEIHDALEKTGGKITYEMVR